MDVEAELGSTGGDLTEVETPLVTVETTLASHRRAAAVLVEPPDLTAALDADPEVRAAWERLSTLRKREYVESVEGAKADVTRQRRIEKTVAALRRK